MQTTFVLIVAVFALLALFVVPLLYGATEAAKSRIASTRRLYARIAELVGGRVVKGTHPWTWEVQFSHGKVEARLKTVAYASSEAGYDTQLQIPWPEQDLRCEIHAKLWGLRLSRLLRMDDIATGDDEFDDGFLVTGNREETIRRMLNEAARSTIRGLAKVGYDNRAYIAIQGAMFVVRKPGIIDYYGNLSRFVKLSLELYDRIVVTSGIRFDDELKESGWSSEVGQCLVCGESLSAKIVYCRSCQTAHHRECWEYIGGCATYGCQSKQASPRMRSRRTPISRPFLKRQ